MTVERANTSLPTMLFDQDHENRAVNDREIRFRPYTEKLHKALGARLQPSVKEETL